MPLSLALRICLSFPSNLLSSKVLFNLEINIGVEYKKNGFYTVIIENPAVEDIGLDRTIIDPTRKWPKRRKTNAPTGLKRLWKHIKKMKF